MTRTLALLAILAGCSNTIKPHQKGPIDLQEAPAFGGGHVRPIPATMPSSMPNDLAIRFDGTDYLLDREAWSEFFADALKVAYKRRRVDVLSGPTLTVTLERAGYSELEIPSGTRYKISLMVRVVCGSFDKRFRGAGFTVKSQKEVTGQAISQILIQILKDPDLNRMIR